MFSFPHATTPQSYVRGACARKKKKKERKDILLLLLATMWQRQSMRKIPHCIRRCYMQLLKNVGPRQFLRECIVHIEYMMYDVEVSSEPVDNREIEPTHAGLDKRKVSWEEASLAEVSSSWSNVSTVAVWTKPSCRGHHHASMKTNASSSQFNQRLSLALEAVRRG